MIRSSTRSRGLVTAWLLLGFGGSLLAQSPDDFARQWPIEGQVTDGLLRVELKAEVYAAVTRRDLKDLVAFDATGQMLALQPMALPEAAAEQQTLRRINLAMFRLPSAVVADAPESIALFIARGDDGRLRQLRADIGPDTAPALGEILLLDASAAQEPLQTLVIELESGVEALDARVMVQTSYDLSNWQALGAPQALVRLTQNGLHLERLRLALGGTRAHYLRVLRHDSDAPLPIAAMVAESGSIEARREPAAQWLDVVGEADPKAAGRFLYRLPGPVPVDRIALLPANGSGTFTAQLSTRRGPDAALQPRAEQVVFQLGRGPDALRPDPIRIPLLRDAEWVIDTQPPQALAPQLELGFVPEQVLLLAQGTAPFRLAAGSARAERASVSLQPVLARLREKQGADWLPALVSLGVSSDLAGQMALQAAPQPIALRQVLLWGVLLAGGLLVIGLVVRLLRSESSAAEHEQGS